MWLVERRMAHAELKALSVVFLTLIGFMIKNIKLLSVTTEMKSLL